MEKFLTIWDWVLMPVYIGIIYLIANSIKKRKIAEHPEYKYFVPGLLVKIFGGIGVVLIYVYYYKGGDTLNYITGTKAMVKLAFKDFGTYFDILLNNRTYENLMSFNKVSMFPPYFMYKDSLAFSVIRFSSVLGFFAFNKYIPLVILIASLSYIGVWKLYKLFINYFPNNNKYFAISILFMPSVIFWGSGLLKDSYTFASSAWFIYIFFSLLNNKKKIFSSIIGLIFNAYILISIKPYIFYIIVAGILIVLTYRLSRKITSPFLKLIILPLIITIIWVSGSLLLLNIGSNIIGGAYSSVDQLIDKAILTQMDLSRDYYGENSFDIGTIEPTLQGLMAKIPPAVNAGLFRPYIWETNNIVMFFSGLENTLILSFCLYVLLITIVSWSKHGFNHMFKALFNNELIVFSISFSLMFAYMIGLTTANFGALVRYKIPLIPFFISTLYIMIIRYNKYDFSAIKK